MGTWPGGALVPNRGHPLTCCRLSLLGIVIYIMGSKLKDATATQSTNR